MATGLSTKIVGQTGEYLVAAELSRRGLIATTFTGNVPHYDIAALDKMGRHVSVQVKTSTVSSWHFSNVSQYCDIIFEGKAQRIGKMKRCPVKRLIVVFVMAKQYGNDRFFVLKWENLRGLLVKNHREYLKKCGGIRPKNWKSLHCAIYEKNLRSYEGKWDTIKVSLQ